MTDLDELEGMLHGGEHQTVFVKGDGVLTELLHQAVGPDIAGIRLEAVHERGMLSQVADHIGAGLTGVGHIDHQRFFLNDISGRRNDGLEGLQAFFNGIDPVDVNGLLQLTVGKLEFVFRTGDGVHEELVKISTAESPYDALRKFLVKGIDQTRFLPGAGLGFGCCHTGLLSGVISYSSSGIQHTACR